MTPQEPHRPTRRQAILFFVFTVLFAASIAIWTLFINKGQLIVLGQPPFSIHAGGESYTCQKAPCTITLEPQTYTVTLEKEGFFDDTQTIKVPRWNKAEIIAQFVFIPVVNELTTVSLPLKPLEQAPLRPPYLNQSDLPESYKRLGQLAFKDAQFSPTGKIALTLGKEVYIFQDEQLLKTEIPAVSEAQWSGEKLVYFVDNGNRQQLISLEGKGTVTIVNFERPMEYTTIASRPAGDFVLVSETSEGEDRIFYLIHTGEKTRKRLSLPVNTRFSHWLTTYAVFEAGEGTKQHKIFLFNPKTLVTTDISAADASNIIELPNGDIVMLTRDKKDASASNVPFEAVIEDIKKIASGQLPQDSGQIFVSLLSKESQKYTTLATIPLEAGESISRLTADEKGERLYFVKGGKVFEIQMKEE